MLWIEKIILLLPVVSAVGLLLLLIALLPGRRHDQDEAGVDPPENVSP